MVPTYMWMYEYLPLYLINFIFVLQKSPEGISTSTTVLPILPINIPIVSKPDITINQYYDSLKSVQLEKIQEIKGLYNNELYSNIITDADLTYIVVSFTIDQLNLSNINELILIFITLFNG